MCDKLSPFLSSTSVRNLVFKKKQEVVEEEVAVYKTQKSHLR